MGKCSHQAGKSVTTSHRFSSYPHLFVNHVKRLPHFHDMAENISSRVAISHIPRKTTSHRRHTYCFSCRLPVLDRLDG
jgi:hypothetical protein